mmetsp:Transcript_8455/g.35331  ORF Transcript_8455/g.35331 Transcript_8455/m.35331 type:complete len:272 (-) Transcript_8455:743-1558(-)
MRHETFSRDLSSPDMTWTKTSALLSSRVPGVLQCLRTKAASSRVTGRRDLSARSWSSESSLLPSSRRREERSSWQVPGMRERTMEMLFVLFTGRMWTIRLIVLLPILIVDLSAFTGESEKSDSISSSRPAAAALAPGWTLPQMVDLILCAGMLLHRSGLSLFWGVSGALLLPNIGGGGGGGIPPGGGGGGGAPDKGQAAPTALEGAPSSISSMALSAGNVIRSVLPGAVSRPSFLRFAGLSPLGLAANGSRRRFLPAVQRPPPAGLWPAAV